MPTTPATLLLCTGSTTNAAAGATEYWSCATTMIGKSATETFKQIPYQYAGIFSKLYARIPSNTSTGPSSINLRKNNTTVTLTLAIPTGTSGVFEDTTHTDTIAAGDLMSIQTITGATGSVSISILSIYFANTQSSEAVTRMAAGAPSAAISFSTPSVSRFQHLAGNIASIATEAGGAQDRIMKAGTLKNMSVYVSANARVNNTTIKSRINAADGTLVITIGAGATGLFQDSTHSDTVAEADLVDTVAVYGAGTDNISYWHFAIDYVAATNQRYTMLNNPGSAQIINISTTNYYAPGGSIAGTLATTELERQLLAREAMTLSKMAVWILANTITASSTLRLRKNGTNGNLVITVAASASGVFTDLSNSDVIAATDEINYQTITGGTGTSLQLRGMQLNADIPLTVVKTLSDTKTIGETSFTRLKKAYKTLSETETIGGTVTRINAAIKALSQTITIGENLARVVARAGILKTLTDTIVISELRARIKGAWRLQP